MLNIREAIEKGQYQKKVGGYIVWGDVLLHKHDIATEADVMSGRASIKGQCINHRVEQKRVTMEVTSITPQYKNGDIVPTRLGRVKVLDIKQDGSCKLLPMDGQQLALPHSGVSWGHGNIFQLPSSRVVASVNN